jgi:hypothetical protein
VRTLDRRFGTRLSYSLSRTIVKSLPASREECDLSHRINDIPEAPKTRKPVLVVWYMEEFVPDPQGGYDLMNIPEADSKYTRKKSPLTTELIMQALDGGNTRRLKI